VREGEAGRGEKARRREEPGGPREEGEGGQRERERGREIGRARERRK